MTNRTHRKTTQRGKKRTGKQRFAARDAMFDVLVLATMSAGKTSFINALIGHDLLHTANEATTACMTSVEHRQGRAHFTATCFSHTDEQLASAAPASAATMRDWNAKHEVKRIQLRGCFRSLPRPAPGLVLHDTPGPNNSQDERHAQLMLEAVRKARYQALCYVLNASQLGTLDDRALLEQLHQETQENPGQSIYFILNKVDLLDPEHGEDIGTYVDNARSYLMDIGFTHPVIIPTMANVALYARKALLAETLTRSQHLKLRQALDELGNEKRALLHASAIPAPIRKTVFKALDGLERQQRKLLDEQALERNQLKQLVAISGVKTVEALIKHQRQSLKTP